MQHISYILQDEYNHLLQRKRDTNNRGIIKRYLNLLKKYINEKIPSRFKFYF